MCEEPDLIEMIDSSDDELETSDITSAESIDTSLPVERTRYKRKCSSFGLGAHKTPAVFHHNFEKQQELERRPGVKIRRVDAVSRFPAFEEHLDLALE
jgi:hypothetical protein